MERKRRHGSRRTPQTLAVERLAGGGDGVGRIGGKTVFVPLAAAGDLVEVLVTEDHRSFSRARLLRVVSASADRVTPPCPLFGDCGGCSWQHIAYPAQLAAKRAIVEDALRRIGRLDAPPVPPVVPSPREYAYRHRARLHAARVGDAGVLGFFRAGSHSIVPVQTCPVLRPALNAALRALADAVRSSGETIPAGSEIRADTGWDGSAVRLSRGAPGGGDLCFPARLRGALRAAGEAAGIEIDAGDAAPPLALQLGPGDDALITTGVTFTQVNLSQNGTLVATALEMADVRPGETVLDLCCGLGNLAVPAAGRGARVLGVDLDGEAVRQAQDNARRAGCDASFVRGDAAAVAAALAGEGRRFDLVLLNPPRTGARAACAALAALGPSRIVVVSCDPATLARDAAVLAAGAYRLADARPLDLFPQTAHVETVALFARVS